MRTDYTPRLYKAELSHREEVNFHCDFGRQNSQWSKLRNSAMFWGVLPPRKVYFLLERTWLLGEPQVDFPATHPRLPKGAVMCWTPSRSLLDWTKVGDVKLWTSRIRRNELHRLWKVSSSSPRLYSCCALVLGCFIQTQWRAWLAVTTVGASRKELPARCNAACGHFWCWDRPSELLMDSTGRTTNRELSGASQIPRNIKVNLSIEKSELLFSFYQPHINNNRTHKTNSPKIKK